MTPRYLSLHYLHSLVQFSRIRSEAVSHGSTCRRLACILSRDGVGYYSVF